VLYRAGLAAGFGHIRAAFTALVLVITIR